MSITSIRERITRRGLAHVFALAGMAAFFWPGDHAQLSAAILIWAWVLADSAIRPLQPNQVTVTTPVEPSSDIRQFASAMAQMRQALINEGHTPEEANRLVEVWLVSLQKGSQS